MHVDAVAKPLVHGAVACTYTLRLTGGAEQVEPAERDALGEHGVLQGPRGGVGEDLAHVALGLVSRPASLAVSLRVMNRRARTRDEAAPVTAVYHAEMAIMDRERAFLAAGVLPKTENILSRMA